MTSVTVHAGGLVHMVRSLTYGPFHHPPAPPPREIARQPGQMAATRTAT
jgi:hypothetical protein